MIPYTNRGAGKLRTWRAGWLLAPLLSLNLLAPAIAFTGPGAAGLVGAPAAGHYEAVSQAVSQAALQSIPPPLTLAPAPADSLPARPRRLWYEGNLLRAVAVPALLIGYGVSVRGDRGWYSSVDARYDIRQLFGGFRSRVDDALVVVPYAELAVLALLRIPGRDDGLNTALLVAKSTGFTLAAFTGLKLAVRDLRPDGTNRFSFPSGHTAMAFCAASLVHQEFRARSQWPGVGAYVIATGVGVFRMVNDRHWQADVMAGAGIGILAVHGVYLTHRYRWGHRPSEGPGAKPPRLSARMSPWAWPGAGMGLALVVPLP